MSLLAWLGFAATITGVASVTDGDTIVVSDKHIRLAGIDAPELAQPLGTAARAHLRDIISGRAVVCEPDGTRSYNRIVAVCSVDGTDIGWKMVRDGYAVRYPQYDRECRYCDAQTAAQAERSGLWAGPFEMPWDYRHRRPK